MGKKTQKVVNFFKRGAVDSTGMMIESNPLFSGVEVWLAHYTDAASINARIFFTASAYLGMGFLYGEGRNVSRKLFKVTDQTKEWKQITHDISYTLAFNMVAALPIYAVSQLVAGEDINMRQVYVGSGLSTVIGAANGAPMSYFVDVVNDLTGTKPCTRKLYPSFVREQNPVTKKLILGGLAAASIGLMATVYSMTPNPTPTVPQHEKPKTEKTITLDAPVKDNSLDKLTTTYYDEWVTK